MRAALLTLSLTLATAALAGELPLQPNPHLTPGAVSTTDLAVICVPGFNQRPRAWHDKLGTLLKYGLSLDQAMEVEDDDLIPRCLGGDNASPANHWPEPIDQARQKDRIEAEVCRAVCSGNYPLAAAQHWFATGDWRRLVR
jgi:hypothetical protein